MLVDPVSYILALREVRGIDALDLKALGCMQPNRLGALRLCTSRLCSWLLARMSHILGVRQIRRLRR